MKSNLPSPFEMANDTITIINYHHQLPTKQNLSVPPLSTTSTPAFEHRKGPSATKFTTLTFRTWRFLGKNMETTHQSLGIAS